MKKLFLMILCAAFTMVGCEEFLGDNVESAPEEALLIIDGECSYTLPEDGGVVALKVVTNLQYRVEIPEEAKSWISIAQTRVIRQDKVMLSIAANESIKERMATIEIVSDDAFTKSVTIIQRGVTITLDAPVVYLTALTDTGCSIDWDAVDYATDYVVYLNDKKVTKTSNTEYTATSLSAGRYDIKVKAVAEGYKDSDFSNILAVEIEGVAVNKFFEQTVSLPTDNEENAAKGVNSSNTFCVTWKGEGVESLSYVYFMADLMSDERPVTDDEIIAAMETLDNEILAEVNGDGAEFMVSDLAGGTEYVLYAYVTMEGNGFLVVDYITTSETILTLGTQAWLGEWNAYTPQIVDITTDSFRDERTDFTLTITPYENYSNRVWVDGFSVLGEGAPAFGVISHEKVNGEYTGNYQLQLMCYETIGELGEGSGVYAVWMPLCSKGNSGYTFVMGSFAGYTLTLNPTTGAVTCKAYSGTLSDNSPFEVKMMDVFGLNEATNELYLMMMDEENAYTEYKAGGLMGVSKQPSISSLSRTATRKMRCSDIPASVVVSM